MPELEHSPEALPPSPSLEVSVAIVTLNEEANLRRCLESVAPLAREIVVVDSGSTDQTAAIAGEYHARFEVHPWEGFVAQKNFALSRCSFPWVLCLDADEALTPELQRAIRTELRDPPAGVKGYWVNRRTFYLGQWIWHAWYPEWRLRLVRREGALWGGRDPHDKLAVTGPTRRLSGDLLHFSFRDLQDHLQRTIKYARISATGYEASGRRFRARDLLCSPWAAFFKHLILKQGWKDGWRGWIISGVRFVDVFAKYAFLWEAERAGSRENSGQVSKPPSLKDV